MLTGIQPLWAVCVNLCVLTGIQPLWAVCVNLCVLTGIQPLWAVCVNLCVSTGIQPLWAVCQLCRVICSYPVGVCIRGGQGYWRNLNCCHPPYMYLQMCCQVNGGGGGGGGGGGEGYMHGNRRELCMILALVHV